MIRPTTAVSLANLTMVLGVGSGYTVMCVQGVQQGSQNTALGCSGVQDEERRSVSAYNHNLGSACHPHAQ